MTERNAPTDAETAQDAPTGADGPRVDPDRPVDPKAAELRAEKNSLKRLGKALGPGPDHRCVGR